MDPSDEQSAIAQVTDRVRAHFPHVPEATVDLVVAECHDEYAGRPIRDFVPILVERTAVDILRAGPARLPTQREPAQEADVRTA